MAAVTICSDFGALPTPPKKKSVTLSLHDALPISWDFFGRNDAEAETPILWLPHVKSWLIAKDPDAGRDGAGWEGGDRRWDGWIASPTWWTWVWVNSGSWWWTGRPGVLQFMESQGVGHDWATELNWCFSETFLAYEKSFKVR